MQDGAEFVDRTRGRSFTTPCATSRRAQNTAPDSASASSKDLKTLAPRIGSRLRLIAWTLPHRPRIIGD